ncbi:MAG: ABC-2 family transporter protein [Bdellovibrionales bacterium]|nr:ABC-2 family transporter protein [Bdellovibrionales bacterium]
MSKVRAYLAFARNSFLNMLAYRLRYYSGFINYLAFVSVNYFIWKAVYHSETENIIINGYSLTEMITYITVGWISRTLYFSNIDYTLNTMVETGEVSMHLIRPVNIQLMLLSQSLGELFFRLFFLFVPVALTFILVFPINPPADLMGFVFYIWSIFAAFIILSQINFIVGLSAFYLQSIWGIIRAKFYIIQLCSGLLLPITFFPLWFQSILNYLPFKYISFIPLQFYLGKIPYELSFTVMTEQILWILILVLIGNMVWKVAVSKLVVQGG